MAVSFAVIEGKIPVTQEMMQAGMAAIRTPCSPDYELVPAIYLAMHAAAPVELISDGELAAIRARDAALDMRNEAMAVLTVMRNERDEAVQARAKLGAENVSLRIEIAFLIGALAQRPAAFTDPDEKPKPNPFREFTTDRRRMGL